ncbi:MAG: hypothetical protein IPK72_13995 [Candidatus Eisenbacteria bacterium]|nr:hypothetical protein [Candidatus Eisenbacteria bacterium]
MKKLALCGLAVMAVAASTSSAFANQAKFDKDNSAPSTPTRGLLDCTDAIAAGCGFTYTGDTSFGVNNATAYNCHPFVEDGPEVVFVFTLGATSNVAIQMVPPADQDLDLHLLASCEEADCIGYSAGTSVENIAADCLPAGTYYIVVDGYAGSAGQFDLSVSCTDCAGPVDNETCDSADPLGCGSISLSTNTNGTTDNYNPGAGNSCTGFSASGGDLVWSVCIPGNGGSVNLTFDEIDYDASIYLVTDCTNLVGTCLDGDDCFPFPCTDVISYTNVGGTDVNAYLIVDGFGGETGNGSLTGSVDCCGPTAVERTTFGGVKAKYGR